MHPLASQRAHVRVMVGAACRAEVNEKLERRVKRDARDAAGSAQAHSLDEERDRLRPFLGRKNLHAFYCTYNRLIVKACVEVFCAYNRLMTAPTVKHRKPKRERKEDRIIIRVTAEQKEALKGAADKTGLGVSPWLLSVGLREAQRPGA
jgi:hypothetical protein